MRMRVDADDATVGLNDVGDAGVADANEADGDVHRSISSINITMRMIVLTTGGAEELQDVTITS